MSKRKDSDSEEVSVDRRRFFRQMFIKAVEGVEKAGQQFAERAKMNQAYTPPPPAHRPYTPPNHYEMPFSVYGPPWPPPFGPPIPPQVRKTLRELH